MIAAHVRHIFFFSLVIMFVSSAHANPVWIDVRSSVEHALDSIEGDVRISHSDIVEQVQQRYPDKATDIRLYCRSGGRAEKARLKLQAAGYSKVSNAGGIDDARKQRGLE